jgi:TolB protein
MSSLDWSPELAAALDRAVPLGDASRADWSAVVARARRGRMAVWRSKRPRGLRLAIVVALIFLLLTGAATATYLLVRDNGALVFGSRFGQLLIVDPDRPGLRTIEACAHTKSSCAIAEPVWSPDGTRLAFVGGSGDAPMQKRHMFLYVAAAEGGPPRRLASCGSCGARWNGRLAWSPDSKRITFTRGAAHALQESLWTISAAGGYPHRLTRCRRCVDAQPAWSPNGRVLAFIRAAGLYTSGLYTIRADGSGLTKIARDAVNEPAWSPGGHWIAFGRPGGFAVASAHSFRDQRLYFAGTHGTGVIATNPAWSPDGRKFVFFRTPGRPMHFRVEVWTMNVDGSDLKRLYRSDCCSRFEASPIWSPDGRMIAFSASSAGGTFVMNADGSDLRRLSTRVSSSLSWQRTPKGER